MSTDYEKKMSQLKEWLDKSKNMKIRAETRLEELKEQKKKILEEIQSFSISPEDLDKELERLRNEIELNIEATDTLIPKEYR